MNRRDFLISSGVALGAAGCAWRRPKPSKPNIIIVVMDTMRADALGCYGYPKPTTPSLDQFAADALLCENAYSTTAWTLPAHASLFSGLPLIQHGTTQEHIYMKKDFPTLAEILGNAGYQCGAVIENSMIIKERGFDRGFHRFKETIRERRKEQSLSLGLDLFREEMAARDTSKPWFCFVNLIEPHTPYDAPNRFRELMKCNLDNLLRDSYYIEHYLEKKRLSPEELAAVHSEYDADVRHVDAIAGEMLSDLQAEGILDESLVIFTADHGEHFGEHQHMMHVYSLYQPLIHIPMLVRFPGHYPQGVRTDLPVQISDLFATALKVAGVENKVLNSVSTDTILEQKLKRMLVAEYYRPIQVLHSFPEKDRANPLLKQYMQRQRTAIDQGIKYIWREKGKPEMYDLRTDPQEKENLLEKPTSAAEGERMKNALFAWVADHGGEPADALEHPEENLDPEVVDSLKTLGYLPG